MSQFFAFFAFALAAFGVLAATLALDLRTDAPPGSDPPETSTGHVATSARVGAGGGRVGESRGRTAPTRWTFRGRCTLRLSYSLNATDRATLAPPLSAQMSTKVAF
jgi:hypothetical protein